MKNLYLITFDVDDTQFLVEANNNILAIGKAILANKEIGGYAEKEDELQLTLKEILNISNYTVEEVDFKMLKCIIRRGDWIDIKDDYVIAFSN